MKRLISYIIFLIFVAKAVAQVNVTGTVIARTLMNLLPELR